MPERSRCIDLDDAEPGMVLAAAVLDRNAAMLLPDATVLTADMLTSLRRRGIDTLMVFGGEISDEEMEAERQRKRKRIDHLFRRCPPGTACSALKEALLDYRVGDAK